MEGKQAEGKQRQQQQSNAVDLGQQHQGCFPSISLFCPLKKGLLYFCLARY